MNTITPKRFWTQFRETMLSDMRDEAWRRAWQDPHSWTDFVIRIASSTGVELGFEKADICPEYYRVDLCYFQTDRTRGNDNLWWNLEVAIEHENDARSWRYEWIKLIHLACALRVVISYYDDARPEASREPALKQAEELYWFASHKAPGDSLVILGPWSTEPVGTFVAYELVRGSFTPLAQQLSLPTSG